MNKFYYKAFGLKIASEFKIDSFHYNKFSNDKNIDVTIQIGDKFNNWGLEPDHRYFNKNDAFYLSVPDVAVYRVKNGNEITVYKNDNCKNNNPVMQFLLGSVFGALLQQRGLLLLHGCTVAGKNGAIMFIGPSGIGKSTVSVGLYKKYGIKLIADDLSPVTYLKNSNKFMIIPSYPGIKLWKDTMDFIGEKTSANERIKPELDKYRYCFHKDFSHEQIPIHKIYFLTRSSDEEIRIHKINDGIEKFKILRQNVYRYEYITKTGKGLENFQQLIELAKAIEIKKIFRPYNKSDINNLIEAVVKDLDC